VPGEWFEWEWDATLFAGSATYYERGRLPYAPGLADALAHGLGLDGRGRLLDVGCGPGTVMLGLARLFAEVVGLDSDADMIEQGRRRASERGVHNARWTHGRAEDLPDALGMFRVVCFAASFHWMDRPLVATSVRDMLEPGGTVVHVDNHHQDNLAPDGQLPAPPREGIAALRRAYLGADRRAGQGIRNTSPGDEAAVFVAAGFTGPQIIVVPDGRSVIRSSDDLVAETFSMSSTAPHLFGDRLPDFEADLRRLFRATSPKGTFYERLPDNELKIWRPVRRPPADVRRSR
jgi:SAM-dependent methyltransferase